MSISSIFLREKGKDHESKSWDSELRHIVVISVWKQQLFTENLFIWSCLMEIVIIEEKELENIEVFESNSNNWLKSIWKNESMTPFLSKIKNFEKLMETSSNVLWWWKVNVTVFYWKIIDKNPTSIFLTPLLFIRKKDIVLVINKVLFYRNSNKKLPTTIIAHFLTDYWRDSSFSWKKLSNFSRDFVIFWTKLSRSSRDVTKF